MISASRLHVAVTFKQHGRWNAVGNMTVTELQRKERKYGTNSPRASGKLRHFLIRELYFICFNVCEYTYDVHAWDSTCANLDKCTCVQWWHQKSNSKNIAMAVSVCLSLFACVCALERTIRSQLACPRCAGGPSDPKAGRTSWKLSARRTPKHFWGNLKACSKHLEVISLTNTRSSAVGVCACCQYSVPNISLLCLYYRSFLCRIRSESLSSTRGMLSPLRSLKIQKK